MLATGHAICTLWDVFFPEQFHNFWHCKLLENSLNRYHGKLPIILQELIKYVLFVCSLHHCSLQEFIKHFQQKGSLFLQADKSFDGNFFKEKLSSGYSNQAPKINLTAHQLSWWPALNETRVCGGSQASLHLLPWFKTNLFSQHQWNNFQNVHIPSSL